MSSPDPISPVTPPAQELAVLQNPVEDPAWNLVDVLAILAFAIFSLLIVSQLALFAAHFLPPFRNLKPADLAQNALILVPGQILAYALVVAFMVQIVRLKQQGSFLTSISWNAPHPERVLLALAGGAGLALFSEVFARLTYRWVPKSLPIDSYLHDTNSTYLFALFAVIVAPFVEELFFRGFLYPALARRMGMGASVVLTAASFAVVHQGQLAHAWVPLAWLFLVGTVLTLVRARTKSVALCVLVHVGYNATLFTLLFIATEGFHHMERA